MQRTEAKASPL